MYQLRSTIIIVAFIGLNLLTIINATGLKKTAFNDEVSGVNVAQVSDFIKVSHFLVDHQFGPKLNLDAASLSVVNQQLFNFEQPVGRTYTKNGEYVDFKAGSGSYNRGQEILNLDREVELDKNNAQLFARTVIYDVKKDLADATGGVESHSLDMKTGDKIQINAERAVSYLSKQWTRYTQNVDGKIKRKRKYEPGITFMADELVADLEQSVINLIGSVQINRLNSKVLAKRAEIWLENYNKKLKYYELNDDIRLYEKFKDKAGRTIERKGFAEKLEGISSEKITILSGAPRVLQGKDIIKGTKIILREDSDLVEVEDSNTRFSLEKDNKEKK